MLLDNLWIGQHGMHNRQPNLSVSAGGYTHADRYENMDGIGVVLLVTHKH